MNRRDFLGQSIKASLLGYLTGATGLAAGAVHTVEGDLSAFNPVSKYAGSYVPPKGALDPTCRQTLTFDVIGWGTDKRRQMVSTPVFGRAVVIRHPLPDGVEYGLSLSQNKGEKMTGRFLCSNGPGHPLREWQLEYAVYAKDKKMAGLCRTRQSGERKEDRVEMHIDGAETLTDLSGPLLCRCGLFDSARHLLSLCESNAEVTMLHEPSGLRPNQRFRMAETGPLPHGEGIPIRTFLQIGPATPPTHWIVDSEDRPLFVTVFLTSWALKAIE